MHVIKQAVCAEVGGAMNWAVRGPEAPECVGVNSPLTVSRARPGIVGDSAATEAMSPPMTCTAGCSGAGAAEAIVSTKVCTVEAMLAISGIATACVRLCCCRCHLDNAGLLGCPWMPARLCWPHWRVACCIGGDHTVAATSHALHGP